MGNVASNIFKNGYHGAAAQHTLFSVVGGFTFREFAALAGFLAVFGKKQDGWPQNLDGDICMTLDDARHMEMTGTFPASYKQEWWDLPDVLAIINAWRKQGVDGIPTTLAVQGSAWGMMTQAQNFMNNF